MQLVIIHGPAAAGKLTIARELAGKTGIPVFHNHLVVDMLLAAFEFGSPAFVEMRESIWLQVMQRAAREQLPGLIFTFTPERTVRPEFIKTIVVTIEDAGGSVQFVRLICPERELESRLENASRAEFGKLRSLEFYRQLRSEGAFEFPPLPDSGLTIDTGILSPSAAASQIIDYFGLSARN